MNDCCVFIDVIIVLCVVFHVRSKGNAETIRGHMMMMYSRVHVCIYYRNYYCYHVGRDDDDDDMSNWNLACQ